MSDLLNAIAAYEDADNARLAAAETVKEKKEAVTVAFEDLVMSALKADVDEKARGAAEGVRWCWGEIDRLTTDENDGLKVLALRVKTAHKEMRDAAKAGNAVAEEAKLTEAEADLGERKGEIGDLRKALKEHSANLINAVKSTF